MEYSRVAVLSLLLLCFLGVSTLLTNADAGSMPVSVPFPAGVTMRQTEDGDSYGGNGYFVRPLLNETPPATAIIIHGLGGTGEEWGVLSLGMSVFSLNYVKFIIPSADVQSVSYLGEKIPSWFDIVKIQGTNSEVSENQLLESVKRIDRIIEGEINAGVPPQRIFVIGFSQGGALALTTFLRSQRNLGGCVGVATWLPLHDTYVPTGNVQVSNNIKGKEILMIHGTEDEAVDFRFGDLSATRIRNDLDVRVNFTAIQGAPHVILSAEVIRMIEDYIAERATGTRNYLRTLVSDLTDTFGSFSSRLKKRKIIPIP